MYAENTLAHILIGMTSHITYVKPRAADGGGQLGQFALGPRGPCYIIKRSKYSNKTVTLIQHLGRYSVDNYTWDKLPKLFSHSISEV